jgi:glycosyltransferase involved in cell wall biosynthesis
MPGVSVVIPTHDYGRFLADAILSATYQTFSSVELVVVDDESTDDAAQTARNLGVRVVRQEHRGVAAARNRGIAETSGEFVALLDADDIWDTHKLEHQAVVMQDPSVVLCHTDGVFLHGDGLEERRPANRVPPERGCPLAHLLPGNRIFPSSVLIRREAVERAGGFDEELGHSADVELWFRLAQYGDFQFVSRRLVKYRVHGDNLSIRGREQWEGSLPALRDRVLADWERLTVRFDPPLRRKYRRLLRREVALCESSRGLRLAREGRYWEAVGAQLRAVGTYPWAPRLHGRLLHAIAGG